MSDGSPNIDAENFSYVMGLKRFHNDRVSIVGRRSSTTISHRIKLRTFELSTTHDDYEDNITDAEVYMYPEEVEELITALAYWLSLVKANDESDQHG